ncbi:hypothetical protein PQO03_02705 [Lentisphaera profundi]|uniref:Uncharacterized protein n=1 Tax=Lentisphaera profundi TaxID=1658616 RepID=A0ABY7VRP0_9BACT|nr:hypothetical protein [Lentisphaera profundi]WDE96870.1 hypothetical protein PQO03_02705 [Lentisphaera profundi]
MNPSNTIRIYQDDHYAKHIGQVIGGTQFFLTTPFIPATSDNKGSQFIALYLFDSSGKFIGAKIDDLGPRESLDTEQADSLYELFLNRLNTPSFCDIEIEAFQIEKHGITFGLFQSQDTDKKLVLQPGNYMSFPTP